MGKTVKRYLPALLAICYFLALAHRGLKEDFNSDDVMNLGVAFFRTAAPAIKGALLFWTGYIRPVGALFYLGLYSYAGYWSLPFRVACFGLIAVNLVLAYRLFRKVGGSRKFAVLALLVVSFHSQLGDIYMSTGTVYDILCQFFLLVALNLYVGEVTAWAVLGIVLCAVAAVGSKEIGVALPGVMAAYELAVRRGRRLHIWVSVALCSLVCAMFLWSRVFVPTELSRNESYQLVLTAAQYLLTTRNYVNLLLGTHLSQWAAMAVLLLPLVLAAVLRSRVMLFGWLFYVITLAPLSFTTPRAGYALYVPYTGVAIMLAPLLSRYWAPLWMAAIVLLQVRADRSWIKQDEHPWGHEPIQTIAGGVSSRYSQLPKGSRLLLVNDPFGKDEMFTPSFVLWLRYHDATLHIQKSVWEKTSGRFVFPKEPYEHIFLFSGQATWELTQKDVNGGDDFAFDGRPLPFVNMTSNESEMNIIRDIGGISPGDTQRWVNQDPVMAFRVPRQPAKFRMDFDVPDVILRTVGPMTIHCWIADQPAPDIVVSKHERRRYEAPLPVGLKTGDVVRVRMHVDNPFISKNDGSRLSFLLWAAGFHSSAGSG